MRSPRMVAALAMVSAGAVGVGWALSAGAPEPSAADTAPVTERAAFRGSAEVEREVEALRAELAALRRQQGQLSKAVDSMGGVAMEAARKAEAATAAAVPPGPAGQAEAAAAMNAARQARQEELYGQLEEAAFTEAREPVWAGRTEALISQAVGSTGPGSQVSYAECRSNLCRVELIHEGAEARTRAVEGLLSTPGLKGETVVRRLQQGGRPVTLLYIAREGTRLPPFRK